MRSARRNRLATLLAGAGFVLLGLSAFAAERKVVRRIAAGGSGGWDYALVDPAAHRLYVTRATRVMVFDTESGKAVGEIPDTSGVHGVALVPDLNRGFTSNGKTGTVSVFDSKTLKVLGEVKVTGEKPDAIAYDPVSKRVFTFNGGSGNATAIDPATNKVAGTVALSGKPEFAVSDGKGTMFVNIEDKSEIVAFDARTLAVKSRWPLAPCEEPSGLAIDRATRRLFSGCSNRMMAVVDADTGKVVATVPIGAGVDANAFDPATRLAYSSNGDGTLTVVHEDSPDKYTVVETVVTEPGARTMALDEATHTIYLPTADFGPPPAPTKENPHPRRSIVDGTFRILVVN
jgi:YVTN family beta-propeller protein